MPKITHVTEGILNDVQKFIADTQKEFVLDVPKYKIDDVLKNPRYSTIKALLGAHERPLQL